LRDSGSQQAEDEQALDQRAQGKRQHVGSVAKAELPQRIRDGKRNQTSEDNQGHARLPVSFMPQMLIIAQ
jgi:hypothetical protein